MPRKVGAVSQVNNKGRHDEENSALSIRFSAGSAPSLGNEGGWDVSLTHPGDAAGSSDLRC